MAIPSKGTGWNNESNLLWQISKQLEWAVKLAGRIVGIQGPQGPQGIQGPQGTAGASVTILGSYTDLAAFNAGAGSLPGTNIGDAWIILTDGSLMSWNGTAWFDAGDIKGPPGDQGPIGPQGTQGVAGSSGTSGTSGSSGISFPTASYGLYAQTVYSTPIVPASGEASLIGTGVGTLSVPANAFSIGDSFVGKMCGELTCANNETLHIRIRSNGIIIVDAAVYTLSISTNKFWDLILDFTIRQIGGTGVAVLAANGVFTYNKNANSNIDGIHFGQINNVTFDTTIINSLTITAEWITANAANTIRTQNFTLTKVY